MHDFTIETPGRSLRVGPARQRVMGIVNLTPDSFSDGGRFASVDDAVAEALQMVREGAAILDIGAESSRPGSEPVDSRDELERLLPVLERLRPRTEAVLSVDTTKSEVARAALAAGADWINDISALRHDPDMAGVIAESGAAVVLMHMLGEPKTMQRSPHYDDALAEVTAALEGWASRAAAAGVAPGRILIDPGIGFGKRLQDNTALLRGLADLRALGYPVLLGASRKTFLGELLRGADTTPRDVVDRDIGTAAVTAMAYAAGVSVHRVHNVRYAMDVLRTLDGIGRN